MTGGRDRARGRGAPAQTRQHEGVGRLESARVCVVMEDAAALVRLPDLERLAWRRTIQHLVPDVDDAALASADALLEELRGFPREGVARLLLTNRGLCSRLPAASEEWGDPAPWQVLTRVQSECRRALLREPRIVERFAWPHTQEVLRTVRAHATRVLLTSTLTWPQLSLVLKALHASDLPDDCLCSDDVDSPTTRSPSLAAVPTLFPGCLDAAVLVRTANARGRKPRACLSLFGPASASNPTASLTVAMGELPVALDNALQQARALPDA